MSNDELELLISFMYTGSVTFASPTESQKFNSLIHQLGIRVDPVKGNVSLGFAMKIYLYSGGQMKNNNKISFHSSGSTETIKIFNIPMKSPLRWLRRMQKRI